MDILANQIFISFLRNSYTTCFIGELASEKEVFGSVEKLVLLAVNFFINEKFGYLNKFRTNYYRKTSTRTRS